MPQGSWPPEKEITNLLRNETSWFGFQCPDGTIFVVQRHYRRLLITLL